MNSNDSNNATKKDFLNISISKHQKWIRSYKDSKENLSYDKSKEKLHNIWYLKPPVDQVIKYLKLMYYALIIEWGFLCEKEIINKISYDTILYRFSKTKIRQLLQWGE